jgi:hypothetical protein
MNSEDTSTQAANGAGRPKPSAEAIQADKPAGKGPPGLNDPAFLARCRNILEEHNKLASRGRTPPMWGFVQGGAFALAILAAFGVYRAMAEEPPPQSVPAVKGRVTVPVSKDAEESAEDRPKNDLAGVMFVVTFFVVLFAPDTMLYLSRRTRKTIGLQHLEDAIRLTLRNFPNEVEHCGGVSVLVDRVELAALVEVLESRGKPDPLAKKE